MSDIKKITKDKKDAWVKALRSGEYEQGQDHLAQCDGNGKNSYCCLGVLAKVDGNLIDANPEHQKISHDISGIDKGVLIYSQDGYFPQYLGNWFLVNTLTSMNDAGKTFDEIADYIEENLDAQ